MTPFTFFPTREGPPVVLGSRERTVHPNLIAHTEDKGNSAVFYSYDYNQRLTARTKGKLPGAVWENKITLDARQFKGREVVVYQAKKEVGRVEYERRKKGKLTIWVIATPFDDSPKEVQTLRSVAQEYGRVFEPIASNILNSGIFSHPTPDIVFVNKEYEPNERITELVRKVKMNYPDTLMCLTFSHENHTREEDDDRVSLIKELMSRAKTSQTVYDALFLYKETAAESAKKVLEEVLSLP